ncbi:uncharacterized protein Z520_02858 [Fonsecaea multimorphosa CBS 102226]|uniref:AMP-dependent synthetase/ligase domain-containing protein n=1 Tax=Fonsecaea multimorphosa CBS 102226 TaxID=1442371 RepID=A0A0D2HHB7_9EURO|nr:uncharacterized protein Z520_02858 [Fonsecaea multimorphosa CBS 102226]KIY01306.1 hypothetical protein Z520_02858 [Fonsecaea multimorphosa CBS 102226]OAL28583.1 hypothetical protein AYO22_02777 [Fonsecaea multimorphosa]
MPYQGSVLPEPIPDNVTIWSWLFETKHSPPGVRPSGGFRDASTDQFLSFDDIRRLATRLSTILYHKYGLRTGDGVCVFSANTIWYPVAMFAAVRLGVVFTGSSPEYGPDEAGYILKASRAKLVFADQSSLKAVSQTFNADRIVLLEPAQASGALPSVKNLLDEPDSGGAPAPFTLPAGKKNGEVCAYLSFTSGTTSRPKGVMISHRNVIAQIMQMRSLGRQDLPRVLLGVLPLFHITGLVQILQLPIVLDQEVILMPKFDMQGMMDTIVKYKCDELWLVPPLLIRLVNDPIAASHTLPLVKQFNTGAAPLAQEIVEKLAKRFPHIAIRQAWGMTESTSALTLTPPALQTYENAHTVGAVVPETVLKIVDPDTGKEIKEGESGEIWAKGPQVTMGYLDNPSATAETFDQEGYLHTGDIGSMLPSGLLLVQDRLKEMIKVKGVGVAPAELEDLLLGHPLVVDVAVIGIPDPYSGELPKAFVVLSEKAKPDPQTARELQDFVRQKKSRSKWLGGGVEFVNQIPKSASGKILRRMLRDQERARAQASAIRSRL